MKYFEPAGGWTAFGWKTIDLEGIANWIQPRGELLIRPCNQVQEAGIVPGTSRSEPGFIDRFLVYRPKSLFIDHSTITDNLQSPSKQKTNRIP
ncbi:hypothetical protein HP456_06595 [Bacillus haikouensis]|uniref:hypothetical protein n=1 Tax=Bacillus haikouensis TaxID=1510468 RepID=UPI001553B9D8|nr:hypothetical protein [Bacillus haikouensis]NQD65590.1 hypothetical protein [Bacillus haikouensis]